MTTFPRPTFASLQVLSNATNVVASGADPTGVVDASSIFQTILTAIGPTGGALYIPPGRYKIGTQLNLTVASEKSVAIFGDAADLATLFTPTGSILNVTMADLSSTINVHDLTLATQASGVGVALNIGMTTSGLFPAAGAQNFITNVTIRGDGEYTSTGFGTRVFLTGVNITGGVSLVNVINLNITGTSPVVANTIGVSIQGDLINSHYGVVYNFLNCNLSYVSGGLRIGAGIQGVSVTACQFTASSFGIIVPAGLTGPVAPIEQLTITQSQFNCPQVGISIGSSVTVVNVSNNMITCGANASSGINGLIGVGTICGNAFTGFGFTNTFGIVTTSGSSGVIVSGNSFFSIGVATAFLTGTSNSGIQSNSYVNVTTVSSPAATTGSLRIGGGFA